MNCWLNALKKTKLLIKKYLCSITLEKGPIELQKKVEK
jgi:hypothetical protein